MEIHSYAIKLDEFHVRLSPSLPLDRHTTAIRRCIENCYIEEYIRYYSSAPVSAGRGDPAEYTLSAFISSCSRTAYPAARSILLCSRPCSSRSRVTHGSFSTRVRRGIPVQTLRRVRAMRQTCALVKRSRKGEGCEGGTCNFRALAFPGAITFREWRAPSWRPDEFRQSTGRNIA